MEHTVFLFDPDLELDLELAWQAMEEERAKYDREILLQGKNLSEEEFQRLLAAHQAAQDELNKNFENERNRQKRSIEDKVGLLCSEWGTVNLYLKKSSQNNAFSCFLHEISNLWSPGLKWWLSSNL